jgi:outer membrane protein TolC
LSLLLPLLASASAAADLYPLKDDPLLTALLAEARRASPQLLAAEHAVAAARARVPQAGALPDPVVSAGYDKGGSWALGSDDDTALRLQASQGLPYPGKRGLAAEVEQADVTRSEHELEQARRALVFEVRKAYADLLLARANVELIEEQRRATRDIEELTRSRYAVGLTSQSDVLRPQAELARLVQMRLHQEGLVTSAIAELNRLLGRPTGAPLDGTPPLSSLPERPLQLPAPAEVARRVLAMSPDVLAAHAKVARAQAASRLAERNRKPDFFVRTSYAERGRLPSMLGFDLGVTLPFYASRKQKQAAAEAEARLRALEAEREALRLRVRARAERSLADLKAAVLEAEAYAKGVLIVDALAVESALASYQTGKLPFVSVLEAHNTRYRDRWEYAELLFHVLWHSASLDELVGEPEGSER